MRLDLAGSLTLALSVVGACHASRESVSSGQIGCNPSQISISEGDTHGGFGESSETWVAECEGRRFYCSRLNTATGIGKNSGTASQVSCKEALSQAEGESKGAPPSALVVERGPAPDGAAGFIFGAEPAHEQIACEAAGNKWQAAGASYKCSGAASPLGVDADVTLSVCAGKICSISVRHHPTTKWMTFVGELKDKLEHKYGAPSEADDGVPRYCKGEEAFARCLDAGEFRLRFGWSWPQGQRVALVVGRSNNSSTAAVLLEYSKTADSAL
jgi:hypothetical protein